MPNLHQRQEGGGECAPTPSAAGKQTLPNYTKAGGEQRLPSYTKARGGGGVHTYTQADEAEASSEGHRGGAAQAVHQVSPHRPAHR